MFRRRGSHFDTQMENPWSTKREERGSTDNEMGGMLVVMGKTKEKSMTTERQILTDAHGQPTHVVLTIEAFQDTWKS
jgi:hypothetical protein